MKLRTVPSWRPILAITAGALLAALHSTSAVALPTVTPSVIASFEGQKINLADDWGPARACIADNVGTRCYRSQHELLDAEASLVSALPPIVPFANCSSALTLYSSPGFAGSTLNLAARGVLFDLSLYGFNNVTSSYTIGACSSRFYDTTSGSTQYPGSTTAGASASAMVAGWDNRVGSVLIP